MKIWFADCLCLQFIEIAGKLSLLDESEVTKCVADLMTPKVLKFDAIIFVVESYFYHPLDQTVENQDLH